MPKAWTNLPSPSGKGSGAQDKVDTLERKFIFCCMPIGRKGLRYPLHVHICTT
jgi:hypothetical protein